MFYKAVNSKMQGRGEGSPCRTMLSLRQGEGSIRSLPHIFPSDKLVILYLNPSLPFHSSFMSSCNCLIYVVVGVFPSCLWNKNKGISKVIVSTMVGTMDHTDGRPSAYICPKNKANQRWRYYSLFDYGKDQTFQKKKVEVLYWPL